MIISEFRWKVKSRIIKITVIKYNWQHERDLMRGTIIPDTRHLQSDEAHNICVISHLLISTYVNLYLCVASVAASGSFNLRHESLGKMGHFDWYFLKKMK